MQLPFTPIRAACMHPGTKMQSFLTILDNKAFVSLCKLAGHLEEQQVNVLQRVEHCMKTNIQSCALLNSSFLNLCLNKMHCSC